MCNKVLKCVNKCICLFISNVWVKLNTWLLLKGTNMEHVEELNGAEAIGRRVDNGDLADIVVDQYMASCPLAGWWSGIQGREEGLIEPWWTEGEKELCEDMDAVMQRNVDGIQSTVRLDHNYNMELDVADCVSPEEEEADYDRDLTELLQGAVLAKDIGQVKRAIRLGANVNERMNGIPMKETPIMRASRLGDIACVDVLIKAGANVHCVDCEGMNALMIAAHAAVHRVVQLLIEAGTDVNAVDIYGKTALMAGCEYEPCRRSFCVWCLHMEPRKPILQALVQAGANVNCVDRDKNTALVLACKKEQDIDVIEFLLDAGCDINRGDYAGVSPLMHAVCRNAAAITATLLHRGADVFQLDFYGESAADFASAESDNSVCVAILLMRAGAMVDDNIIDADRRLQVERDMCVKLKLRLSHICREKIRLCAMKRYPGGHMHDLLRELPLPTSIIDFVADSRRYILDV